MSPRAGTHKMVTVRCPGHCGRYVRYDGNVNGAQPRHCRSCIVRLRREVSELVDSWVVADAGGYRGPVSASR